jgi:hypothetical protein
VNTFDAIGRLNPQKIIERSCAEHPADREWSFPARTHQVTWPGAQGRIEVGHGDARCSGAILLKGEMNMFFHKTIRVHWLLAGALLLSASAFAQEEGKVEVAAFGGVSYSISDQSVHPLFGGSVDARVVDHLRVFGEFSIVPLASATESESGVVVNGSEKLTSFGGGLNYGFGSSKRVVPYVLLAVGDGRLSASATANVNGYSVSAGMASNSIYFGVGGGARIYIGEHWGIKPEVRIQRYGISNVFSTAAFSAGVFYQFGR